jgi:ABC-2 type transport system permease protein
MIIRNTRRFYGYLKKDFTLLVKRKKYMYLTFLLPFLVGILFLLMISPSNAKIKVGVCDFDNTDYSTKLIDGLSNSFDVELLTGENCALELVNSIKTRKRSLGIGIKEGFSEDINNLEQTNIVVYYDNTDIAFSNLISWKVDVSLNPYKTYILDKFNQELKSKVNSIRTNVDVALELSDNFNTINSRIRQIDSDLKKIEKMQTRFLIEPITTIQKPIYEGQSMSEVGIAFIFPILAMFIVLMLSSTSLIYDKKTHFTTRVKSSTSLFIYLISKIVFFVLLTILQFIIILILFLSFGAKYQYPFLDILSMLVLIGVINSLIGIIIGIISDSEGVALLFSLIISFPLMLLSGIFSPLQAMPIVAQFLAKILPLYHEINLVKSVLFFNAGISSAIVITALILFIITYYLVEKRVN